MSQEHTQIPNGREIINGKEYLPTADGGMMPVELIKPQDLLEDETVRKVVYYAKDLSDQVSRFKQHTYDDLEDFDDLLAQNYNVTKGGAKGNKTYMSHCGMLKVQVSVAKFEEIGPAINQAKAIFDELLRDWAEDARPEIRAIIENAFMTDGAGRYSREAIRILLKVDSDNGRFKEGQKAISDAMRFVASKKYVRCYERDTYDGEWRAVTIDLAKA